MLTELREILDSYYKTEELDNLLLQFYEDLRRSYEQGKFGEAKWYDIIREFENMLEYKLLRNNVDCYVKYSVDVE